MKKKKLKPIKPKKAQPEEWRDPSDLFKEHKPEPFDPDCVPASLREYPVLLARSAGMDISLLLTSAVVVAASAIDDGVHLTISNTWSESARLWVAVIAHPGYGKTPMQKLLTAPLRMLHKQLMDKANERWSNLSDEERKLQKHPDRIRLVVTNATVEALEEVLAASPRGVLTFNEELASIIGAFGKYSSNPSTKVSKDRGDWLALFDGGDRTIERVGRGTTYVPNWSSSILTATTPKTMEEMSRYLPEDGLMQRFIVAYLQPKTEKQIIKEAEMEAARNKYDSMITKLYNVKPQEYALGKEAKALFDAWTIENLKEQDLFADSMPAYRSHLAKLPLIGLRTTVVFHLANGGRDKHIIQPDTMSAVLRFVASVQEHVRKLYDTNQGSQAHILARDIARYILARSDVEEHSRRFFTQNVRQFRNAEESEKDRALAILCDMEWLRPVPTARVRDRWTRWTANPGIAKTFPKLAAAEKTKRAARFVMFKQHIAEHKQKKA